MTRWRVLPTDLGPFGVFRERPGLLHPADVLFEAFGRTLPRPEIHPDVAQRFGLARESVIHSAAGGIGLAAIEVARDLGAEIIATAGSEDRKAFLRSLGVERVASSRDPSFAEEVMA